MEDYSAYHADDGTEDGGGRGDFKEDVVLNLYIYFHFLGCGRLCSLKSLNVRSATMNSKINDYFCNLF